MNVKEVIAPAVGLDGETDTAKKHLVVVEQVSDCPAAGAASMATPSMLAVSTKKATRATMKPAFGMVTPSPVSTEGHERASKIPLCRRPALHRTYPLGIYGWSCGSFVLCDQAAYHA